MSTMLGKAALSAVTMALGGLTLAPAEALAMEERCHDETLWLGYSGWSAVQYTLDNGVSWYPAPTVSPPRPEWAVIPGTSYINYTPDGSGNPQSWARYRTSFTIPQVPYGYTLDWDQLAVEVHADNSARMYIDGDLYLTQPLAEILENFQGPPSLYTAYPQAFDFGSHALEFDIFNFGGPTGLDFNITYRRRLCVPCISPRQLNCENEPL